MAMRGCSRLSRTCFRLHLVNAGRSHKQRNMLNAIPRRERGNVQAELVGIWEQATKQEALIHRAAFKAKYAQRYRGSDPQSD
jgi:transposase-like protein